MAGNFALKRDGRNLEFHHVTADQWLRVKEVFDEAVDRHPQDRGAFIAAACGGDGALRTEVERLLTAHDDASGFIERSPVAGTGAAGRGGLTGQTVGRYRVGDRLGTGGMGEVYAAKDLELGRTVAIKFALTGDAGARARLKREAQHVSRLNHPHICTIHEVGTYQDHPFIVMERVEGQPLSELARGKGLSVDEVVRYGRQVADALAHAHRNGVTHRDLKSANVLITRDGRAKVLDFGLARTLTRDTVSDLSPSHDSVTDEGAVAGTLSVLAPEILRGGKADARSDIWALGVLLHEMASGERPFRGATGFELTGAILHSPPSPLPDGVPSSLRQIVQRCLETDPANRYQHAGEVSDALATGAIDSSQRAHALVVKFKVPVAVAAILLALAAFLFFARRNADPVALGESGRPAIAVMHFQHAGPQDSDTAWLASGVPSMLVTGLAQTRGLEIVSERRLLEALGQQGNATLASLNKEDAANVARRAGAGAIVVGSIFRAGSELRIDAQLEDLASGRVLAAKSVRGTDVFGLVDQLAADIRDAVGLEDAPGVRNVATVSSTSLEAYRLHSEGVKAASNVRLADADKLFKAAVAIDPSFAEAYMWLAHTSSSLGRKNDRDKYFKLAMDNVDRLSERHRLMLDIQVARERGDRPAALRMLDELLVKFPDTEEAYQLALHFYQMGPSAGGDRQRLLKITAAGAAAMPSSSLTRNAHGYALLSTGRYADAIREFEAYARIAPREPNPLDSLGEAYLKMGDAEKAIAAYSRALAIDPTFTPSINLRAWSHGVLGRYDAALADDIDYPHFKSLLLARVGRYRDAVKVLADGETRATAQGNHTRAGGLRHVAAMLALERGDTARALRDVPIGIKFLSEQSEDVRRVVSVMEHLLLGLAHVRAGRLADAEASYEAQGRIYKGENEYERAWRRALEAEIALARGNLPQAETACSAMAPPLRTLDANAIATSVLFNDLPSRDGLARLAIARGDLDGAIKLYRGLLTYGPESKWIAAYEPRYVLQIARLLEKKGDRPAALVEYRRFLDLWKHADADLPELTEARRAVARLT